MEAMAMGKPAVCSDNDGNLEAVDDDDNGLIFPRNDHTALACKLLTLIDNKELRIKIGEKARHKAEKKFDMRHLARQYEELYAELIQASRK